MSFWLWLVRIGKICLFQISWKQKVWQIFVLLSFGASLVAQGVKSACNAGDLILQIQNKLEKMCGVLRVTQLSRNVTQAARVWGLCSLLTASSDRPTHVNVSTGPFSDCIHRATDSIAEQLPAVGSVSHEKLMCARDLFYFCFSLFYSKSFTPWVWKRWKGRTMMRPDVFLQMKESLTAWHRTSKCASVHVAGEGKSRVSWQHGNLLDILQWPNLEMGVMW